MKSNKYINKFLPDHSNFVYAEERKEYSFLWIGGFEVSGVSGVVILGLVIEGVLSYKLSQKDCKPRKNHHHKNIPQKPKDQSRKKSRSLKACLLNPITS